VLTKGTRGMGPGEGCQTATGLLGWAETATKIEGRGEERKGGWEDPLARLRGPNFGERGGWGKGKHDASRVGTRVERHVEDRQHADEGSRTKVVKTGRGGLIGF